MKNSGWRANVIQKITSDLEGIPKVDLAVISPAPQNTVRQTVDAHLHRASEAKHCETADDFQRVREEFCGVGPLRALIEDQGVTEIIVNGPQQIWFEKHGRLHRHPDHFITDLSFRQFIEYLSQSSRIHINMAVPADDGRWAEFRVHLIGPPIHGDGPILT